MISNEQRAHDLATAVCVDICNIKRLHQLKSNDTTVNVDYFEEYMTVYKALLDAFNREFPDC